MWVLLKASALSYKNVKTHTRFPPDIYKKKKERERERRKYPFLGTEEETV